MRKLLKHEFIATGRTLPFIYLSCALAAGVYWIAAELKIEGLIVTSTLLLFAGMAAAAIVTLVLIIQRFFRSMFGAEGYLTQTLPVSPRKILFSKLLTSYLWLLFSYIFIFLMAVLFLFVLSRTYGEVAQAFDFAFSFYDMQRAVFHQLGAVLIGMILIQNLSFIVSLMFCITLGHLPIFTQRNAAVSFGAYIVFYMVSNTLKAGLVYFLPFSLQYNGKGLRIAAQAMGFSGADIASGNFSIGLGSVLFDLILAAGLFFLTAWLIRSKTSVRG